MREHNVELLRIISMIMIVTLHCLNFGGFLNDFLPFTTNYIITWTLEAFCFVAVNVYVIIGSYYMVKSKFNIKRFIKIILQVLFYSILIFVISFIFKIPCDKTTIIQTFLPVSTKLYWYVTIYLGLCIIAPFLNILIHNINKKQYCSLLIINFILFSLWPIVIPKFTNLSFGGSYSISWFINLYLIAGYLRLHFDINKYNKKLYLLNYIVLSLILSLMNLFIICISHGQYNGGFIYNYYSFMVVLSSISLFLYFRCIKIKSNFFQKIINFLAPLTFGVYLIHEHPIIRVLLWEKVIPISYNPIRYIIFIITSVLLIYIFLSLIDYIRKIVMNKLFKKINESSKINKFNDKILEFL